MLQRVSKKSLKITKGQSESVLLQGVSKLVVRQRQYCLYNVTVIVKTRYKRIVSVMLQGMSKLDTEQFLSVMLQGVSKLDT